MNPSENVLTSAPETALDPPGAAWVQRYLALLGVENEPPGYDALARLTRAHLARVPFENVSSLRRALAAAGGPVPPLDLETQLADWEERRAGGICFEVTNTFPRLLNALGYRAYPVLARISFPGQHSATVVELDGERYLVDVANGAPFWEPVPLRGEVQVHRAGLAYRFRPGSDGEWLQERGIGREWRLFCTYDLRPSDAESREAAYQRHHIPGESFVASEFVLIHCQEDEVWVLRNGLFTHHRSSGKRSRRISTSEELEQLARDVFQLPDLPVHEGVMALEALMQRRHA
jgi:arylamine N-acetyltransferase